jgi:hypothetical protein
VRCSEATLEAIKDGRGLCMTDIANDLQHIKVRGMLGQINEKQNALKTNKTTLSSETIELVYAPDPEYKALRELASGCQQAAHTDFLPNEGADVRERTIPEYPNMGLTLGIHAADEYRRGHSIIMPLAVAKEICTAEGLTLHVSEMFMRDKPGAPLGRPIPDYSFNRHGPPMAHEDLKPQLASQWGTLRHPTVVDLCNAMSNARDNAEGDVVIGARTDIKSAYTRILIRSRDCTVMAKLISMMGPDECGPMISIPIVNQWGSQVAGYAFDVITRALRRRAHDRGGSDKHVTIIYVDDHITFGTIPKVQSEVANFMNDSRMLLGHDAIQESKNEQGTRIDAIGWRCDCNDWTVAPSARAFAKLANIFFNELPANITNATKVTVQQLMRLSSYAIRYSIAIIPMRPYSSSFAMNTRGRHVSVMAKRRLLPRTITDIGMWREVIKRSFSDPSGMKVPIEWPIIESQTIETTSEGSHVEVWTDAQTSQGGIGVYLPNESWLYAQMTSTHYEINGAEVAIDINILEYIGVILGLIQGIRLLCWKSGVYDPNGARTKRIHVFTDNTACISWLQKRRSMSPTHAILMQLTTMLQVQFGCLITAGHVPGIENVVADAISRSFKSHDGERVRLQLQPLRHESLTPQLLESCRNALDMRKSTPSTTGLAVRTALVNAIGHVSQPSTVGTNWNNNHLICNLDCSLPT